MTRRYENTAPEGASGLMLIPRNVKYRKQHHPKRRGKSNGGTKVTFGE